MSRSFDVVVLGATGYTGTMVVDYLNQAASAKGIKWAAAGRNQKKVEAAIATVGAKSVPVLVADTSDAASLDELAKQTTVIIDCAGPFDIHGPPVLDACMKHSTHYVDITGEFTYVRTAIEKHHEAARKAGIFLIPTCGFDSVPSDIGNFLIHEEAKARSTKAVDVRTYFSASGGGGFSGGTAHTICNIMKTIRKKDMSPASLNPSDTVKPASTPFKKGFWFDPWVGKWTAPFLMAGVNERVVRRSNALNGSSAAYHEMLAAPIVSSIIVTFVFYAMAISFAITPVRNLLQKYVLPAPGTGPSETARAKSKFVARYRGKAENGDLISAELKFGKCAYWFTAVSVSECALCIVDLVKTAGKDKRSVSGHTGGVLTPSTAFGQNLVNRLSAAGAEITVNTKKDSKKE